MSISQRGIKYNSLFLGYVYFLREGFCSAEYLASFYLEVHDFNLVREWSEDCMIDFGKGMLEIFRNGGEKYDMMRTKKSRRALMNKKIMTITLIGVFSVLSTFGCIC